MTPRPPYATRSSTVAPGTAYNIVDDEPMNFGAHIIATATAFGLPKPMSVPAWLLRPMGLLSEMLRYGHAAEQRQGPRRAGLGAAVPDRERRVGGIGRRYGEVVTSSTDVFAEHRNLLFSVAYRMTGSVADAEDIVQNAWLRWSAADTSTVAAPVPYLVKTVTNLALDEMTSARARRETYVGPWLPEPLLTSPDARG